MSKVTILLVWAGVIFWTVSSASCSRQDAPGINSSNSGEKYVFAEKSVVKSMKDIESRYSSSENDWLNFLQCWNEKLVSKASESQNSVTLLGLLAHSKSQLANVGSPQFSHRLVALKNLEQRLGSGALPKSYKDFALVTGGTWVASADIDTTSFKSNLINIENVGYFKDIDKLNWPGVQKAMNELHMDSIQIPASEYYRYDDSQDRFRWAHLHKVVKVGELEQGTVLLINPAEITADGEWEAWLLSTQIGAQRYRSFAEMMQTVAYQEIFDMGGRNFTREKLLSSCSAHLRTAATFSQTR